VPCDHPSWVLEAHYLALGLVAFVCTLAPQRIIMGGGVMHQATCSRACGRRYGDCSMTISRSQSCATSLMTTSCLPDLVTGLGC